MICNNEFHYLGRLLQTQLNLQVKLCQNHEAKSNIFHRECKSSLKIKMFLFIVCYINNGSLIHYSGRFDSLPVVIFIKKQCEVQF